MATRRQSSVTAVKRPGRFELEGGVPVWKEGDASELCGEGCGGGHPIPRTATQFSCDHGTWDFEDSEEPSPSTAAAAAPAPDPRDAELAQLREELAKRDARDAEAAKQAAAQGGDTKDKGDGKAPAAKDDGKPPAK